MTTTFTRVASAIAIACATLSAPAALAQEPAAEASDAAAAAALHALFERSEAAMLDRNPVTAFFRGDFSDADRMGDYSPASYAADRAAAQANLAELATIDRAALGETDRIAYDVFEYTQQRTLAQTAPDVLPTVLALP
ncbi:MAG TPA: DUF885 domain-containing protein, partial [Erythrobacter sp.]|nr:DUF885 domain-containing protein [Erythrobacter sp.]